MYRIGKEEIKAVSRVIKSGKLFRYLEEPGETDKFEQELAEKIGVKYAFSVNSGTSALICAFAGLGIGPGDEIIVPGYTFMASATAVLAVGAIPVISEVDESLTMDAVDVRNKISARTKAIMPVHLCGFPCDMDALTALVSGKEIHIVEDSCQADGGSYKGKRLGSIGTVGAFSFNYYKIMTCGEGGAVLTDNSDIYHRGLIQHDSGRHFRSVEKDENIPPFIGVNFRTTEISSAILRVQLRRVDSMLESMRKQKRFYYEKLAGHEKVGLIKCNDLDGDCGTTTGLFFPSVEIAETFEAHLKENGVSCSRPIDSGRHVYSNWDPILEHLGAHHPARNPFLMKENAGCSMEYTKEMCPNTLNYLARTVFIGSHPDEKRSDYERKLKGIEKTAAEM